MSVWNVLWKGKRQEVGHPSLFVKSYWTEQCLLAILSGMIHDFWLQKALHLVWWDHGMLDVDGCVLWCMTKCLDQVSNSVWTGLKGLKKGMCPSSTNLSKDFLQLCSRGATSALTGEIVHRALSLGQRCALESNEALDCFSSTLPINNLFKTYWAGVFRLFFCLNTFKVSHPFVESSISSCLQLNTLFQILL